MLTKSLTKYLKGIHRYKSKRRDDISIIDILLISY